MSRQQPAARLELSRERILSAALELIDRVGLPALNMRDLGAELGASTMSVYRYFRNKSELLDAVVDLVVEDFAPPPPQSGWRAQARAMCVRVRAAMLSHPELADLIGREFRRSPTSLRVNAAIIARLGASGVPKALLPDTYWALSSYTTGYTLLEAQARRRRRPNVERDTTERVRKLAAVLEGADVVPAEEAADAAAVLARPLNDAQFLFGLDCILEGLAARFRAQRPS